MKVSVVIPAYNGEGTIAAAVESALAQKFDGEFQVVEVVAVKGRPKILRLASC